MSLVDMKITKADREAEESKYAEIDSSEGNKYPYGLEIRLDDAALKKLGCDLKSVGDEVTIIAKAHVTSVSQHSQKNGTDRNMSLQISAMEIEEPVDDEKRASKMYSGE